MSLRDLLPEGAYEEITAGLAAAQERPVQRCPRCGRETAYDRHSAFRPFCSERCRLLDLGAWAGEEHVIRGQPVNEDADAELLNDPGLPKRHQRDPEH